LLRLRPKPETAEDVVMDEEPQLEIETTEREPEPEDVAADMTDDAEDAAHAELEGEQA